MVAGSALVVILVVVGAFVVVAVLFGVITEGGRVDIEEEAVLEATSSVGKSCISFFTSGAHVCRALSRDEVALLSFSDTQCFVSSFSIIVRWSALSKSRWAIDPASLLFSLSPE